VSLLGRLLGGLLLDVLDLLEDLPHAGTHQLALSRSGLAIATPDALGFAWVEILLVHHPNRPTPRGTRQPSPALQIELDR